MAEVPTADPNYIDVAQMQSLGNHLDRQRNVKELGQGGGGELPRPTEVIGAGGFTPSEGLSSGILYQD